MWSNNTGGTQAVSALGIIVGAGGRPGQVIGRAGGHQRGGVSGRKIPAQQIADETARPPPPRARYRYLADRPATRVWPTVSARPGFSRCAAPSRLAQRFHELVVANPHQVRSFDKQDIIDTLKKRVRIPAAWWSLNQDIYLVDPIGAIATPISFSPPPLGAKKPSCGPMANGVCACITGSTIRRATPNPIGGSSPNLPSGWVSTGSTGGTPTRSRKNPRGFPVAAARIST